MRFFVFLLAAFCCVNAAPVSVPSEEQRLEGFVDNVKELFSHLKELAKEKGLDYVCSSKLSVLMDLLGVPDELDGALSLVQQWICPEEPKMALALQSRGFVSKVKEIWGKLKNYSYEFVCSAKIQKLMDILGVPDELDGAVSLAQKYLCSGEEPDDDTEALALRSEDYQLEGFVDTVKELWNKMKTMSAEFVCSAKVAELCDILGVPDELDGTISMIQGWICAGHDEPEVELQLRGFVSKVKEIWAKLKNYSYEFVCSAKIQKLMDILGVPDELDGAVSLAQKYLCSGEEPEDDRLALRSEDFQLEGFVDTVKTLWNKMKTMSAEFVCSAKVAELMDILGVPDELDGTIAMIQRWICSGDDEPEALALRSEEIQLQGFVDTVKTLWNKMKSMSKEFVCSAKVAELCDILGVPDELDGTISMIQGWICPEL